VGGGGSNAGNGMVTGSSFPAHHKTLTFKRDSSRRAGFFIKEIRERDEPIGGGRTFGGGGGGE
jgi:hypothetical protein